MGSVVAEGIAVKPKVPPDEDSTVAIQMYKTIAQMDPGNLLHTVCFKFNFLGPWCLFTPSIKNYASLVYIGVHDTIHTKCQQSTATVTLDWVLDPINRQVSKN